MVPPDPTEHGHREVRARRLSSGPGGSHLAVRDISRRPHDWVATNAIVGSGFLADDSLARFQMRQRELPGAKRGLRARATERPCIWSRQLWDASARPSFRRRRGPRDPGAARSGVRANTYTPPAKIRAIRVDGERSPTSSLALSEAARPRPSQRSVWDSDSAVGSSVATASAFESKASAAASLSVAVSPWSGGASSWAAIWTDPVPPRPRSSSDA